MTQTDSENATFNQIMSDSVILGLLPKYNYRFTIVELTETAKEAIFLHSLGSEMSVFLSKTMMGALFLAEMTKNQQRVSIQWKDETKKSALAYSDRYGRMKAVGYADTHEDGDIRNEFILGQGIMKVIRWELDGEFYQSYTNLIEDTFEFNFQKYLTESEQVRAIVGMEVNPFLFPGNAFFAKGLFLEALPDATEDDFISLTKLIQPLLKKELFWLQSPKDIHSQLQSILQSPLEILSEESPSFTCDCSKPKVSDIIASLGRVEAQSILDEMNQIEITCEFCKTAYQFDASDMDKLFPE